MADCSTFDTLVVDWLYDELDPAEAARFTRHVDGCAACWQTAESFIQMRALMRALPEEEPPGAISARVLREAAVHAASRQGRGLGSWISAWIPGALGRAWAHPAAAAVASLVLVAGVAGALFARDQLEMAAPRVESAAVTRDAERGEIRAVTGVMGGSASSEAPPSPAAQTVQPSEMATAESDDGKRRDLGRPSGMRAQMGEEKLPERALRGSPAEPAQRAEREVERGLAARTGDAEEQAAFLAQDVADEALLHGPSDRDGKGYQGGLGRAGKEAPVQAPEATGASPKAASAAPEPAAPDKSERAQPPVTTDKPDARRRTAAWAEARHAELRAALNDQQCTRAVGIADDIQAREPDYYRSQLASSKELAACQAAGGKAANRAGKPQERASKRGAADTSKPSGSRDAD